MSEFSESYHLRSERTEDAIELLRHTKRKGYVYPSVNGWVTFLADGGVFEPDEQIVAAASRPLLHYVFAEDHGWSFTFFDNTNVICGYLCDWNDEIKIDDSKYSREALLQFVPVIPSSLLNDFERRMHPKDFEELFEVEPSKLLAQAMGLEHYDWLAYDYIASDFHLSPSNHPDIIEVK